MTTLIEQLIIKMGLQTESTVLEKTRELVRLLELRSVNVPLQINEYGKIVLCADIAASLLSAPFDKEQALKISGLRKTHYANHKRMVEKLLELNRIMGVDDICIQLGVNEVSQKAHELHDLYKRITVNNLADVDISHPQYAAMAVYYAGKILKKKIAKTKIMSYSNLRPMQWNDLEQHWSKFLAKHYKDDVEAFKARTSNNEKMKEICSNETSKKNIHVEIEDYLLWKDRMLAMAENKLKHQKTDKLQMEKENIV